MSGVDSDLDCVASPSSFFFVLFFFFFSIRPPLTLLPFSLSLPPPTEYSSPAMLAALVWGLRRRWLFVLHSFGGVACRS